MGPFWDKIRKDFPKVAHAVPIYGANEVLVPDISGLVLPRVWLMSEDTTHLIQLQQNRFHFNWRQDADNKATYIRFPAVRSECLRIWDLFEKFISQELGSPLQPTGAELTYINILEVGKSGDVFQYAQRALRDVAWDSQNRKLPVPTQGNVTYSFPVPNDVGELQVSTLTGRKLDGTQVLKLELTVRGKHSEERSFGEWSQLAHDFLVEAFRDLTTPEMHNEWQLREE
ncbi:uncharacterized protein (TIGR04255 family) [Paraburkholderia sp. MM5496-R1]|uniref:TIGR04255 family protein n=1 Tax=Paraburkholderia sp. MM5496-R1 TaxID=2991065 RepID=UPI003D1E9270